MDITLDLLARLEGLSTAEKIEICALADVPFSSLSQWRNGRYHPGLPALTRLYAQIGREITTCASSSKKDA